mmetsp:Transcript_7743/g.9319  ORF Transcript_7743/g.9319 Transcript_7743/m.9319 type:complete len:333 (-) Transcript_7743:490-1488(-)
MPLGERAHQLGVVNDEARADALRLKVLAHEFVNQARSGTGSAAVNVLLNADLIEELASLLRLEVATTGQLSAESLLEALHHLDAAEGRREVDIVDLVGVSGVILGVILDDISAMDRLDHLREELLSEAHEVVVVSVGPIEFAGGELRVMGQIDTLVAELLADLEDAVHTTDDEHLQVELGSDTHEKLHVQVVVESLERLGGRTTGNHVHHGGLDLDEVTLAQEVAEEVQDAVPCVEDLLHWVMHNQIKVALAVAGVLSKHLGLALTLGEHMHAVGKADDLGWSHRQLAGLGAAWAALDTDNVTAAERRVKHGEFSLVEVGLSQNLHLGAITL